MFDWLRRALGPPREARSAYSSRDPSWIGAALGTSFGGWSNAGTIVTPESASAVPAVHACVQLMSTLTARLPLHVYRRTPEDSREVDRNHTLHGVLNEVGNADMTAFALREYLAASVLLTGNGYASVERNGNGQVMALLPIAPHTVQVERLPNGRKRYTVHPIEGGGPVVYLQDEVLHVAYRMAHDGLKGLSPIQLHAETLGIALKQQVYEGVALQSGYRPAGWIEYPGKFRQEDRDKFIKEWRKNYGNVDAAGGTAILEGGMKYNSIPQMANKDAQFIETRKMTLLDVARIFGVPPPAIGILDNANYSNVVEMNRMLVTNALAPFAERIEQAIQHQLLTPAGRRTHFLEHNFEGLLRGDTSTRFNAYATAFQNGFMTRNEIRRLENLPPVDDGGDELLRPANLEPVRPKGG